MAADVVLDSCGTAYVADTQSSNLFRVTADGKASVLLNSPLLAGNPDVGVPGVLPSPAATSLVLVRDDLLIVAKADGTLVRVPVEHPKQAGRVQLDTNLVPLAASLRGLPGGSIAAVSSGLLSGKDAVVRVSAPSTPGAARRSPSPTPWPTRSRAESPRVPAVPPTR